MGPDETDEYISAIEEGLNQVNVTPNSNLNHINNNLQLLAELSEWKIKYQQLENDMNAVKEENKLLLDTTDKLNTVIQSMRNRGL